MTGIGIEGRVSASMAEVLAEHQLYVNTSHGDAWTPPEESASCSCGVDLGGWVASGADWEWPDGFISVAAKAARGAYSDDPDELSTRLTSIAIEIKNLVDQDRKTYRRPE